MPAKNIPSTSSTQDPNGKKPSSSKWIKFTAGATILGSLLISTASFNQNDKASINQNKKNLFELMETNDSLDHQKIINMKIDSIFAEYGQEK